MALRPHLQTTSSTSPLALNTYVAPKAPAGWGELFNAGWEADSDIKAYWDLVSRPAFEPDPVFDPLTATKGSKYWDSPFRNNFAEAGSKAEWDFLSEKIEREQRNNEILESAGWTGVGVRLLYGMVSPTMLLPAVSTFRGGRGVAAAAGLGAAAGALQEIPLQLAQETRDFSDVIASVGGGAFLGGVMGAGYNVWRGMARLPEVRRVELDMAAGETPSSIHPSARLAENPVLIRADGDGVRVREGTVLSNGGGGLEQPFMVFRGPEVTTELPANSIIRDAPELAKVKDGTVVMDSDEAQALRRQAAEDGVDALRYKNADGEEIVEVISPRALAALDSADELTVLQEGTFVRAPSSLPEGTSVGAARTPVEASPEGLAPTFGGNTKVVEVLSKVSPPARVIAQKTFAVARAMMLKLSQGGVTLEGASAGKVARAGGTVETRARLYDAFLNRTIEIIDNAYVDYLYGSARPGFAANMKASARSTFGQTGEKLNKVDFQKAIGRAMFDGDRSDIAEVQTAAQALRKDVYDPIMREATGEDVKLFKLPKEKGEDADLDETADLSYLTRLYDTQAINRDLRGFHDFLTAHFEQKILARYEKAVGRAKNLDAIDDEMIKLLGLDADTAAKLQADTLQALTDMGETDAEVLLKTTQKEITRLRKEIREGAPNKDVLSARMEAAKAEVKALKTDLRERLDERASYRKRLAVLDRTWWAEEQSRASVLKDINRLEELSLASLNAVFTRGMAMQRKLDSFDPVQMGKQLEIFRNQIVSVTERIDKAYAKLAKEGYRRAEGWSAPFAADINRFGDLKARLEDKIARFDEADDILGNLDVVKAWLESVQRDMLEATNTLNLGRGERIAGLKARADFDPRAKAEGLVAELQANKAQRATELNEQVRGLGITGFDPETAKVVAREMAESVSGRIRGMNNRIAGLELLGEERGAALARQLDFRSIDAVEWLETDILRATQTYVRQMAGDIELKRAFGDVNAKEQFAELEKEFNAVNERRARGPVSAEELAEIKAKHAKQMGRLDGVEGGEEAKAVLSQRHAAELAEATRPAATKKELDALRKEYDNVNYALRGSIARIRRTWGIPDNPDGFAARAGKVLLDLSVLRYMGGVLVSSFPDMARVVTAHTLGRTITDGLVPLLLNFEGAKASMRELRLAGGALDHVLTSRAAAYLDILESSANSTRFERGVNTMAANIGRVAGFDYWTSALKQFSSVIENTRMADSIELVTKGGDPKDVLEATEYLAKLNINQEYAERIAAQFDNGGSTRVGNMRYPNTEDWTDPGAVIAYRAALRQASDNIIITPGLERPLVMDVNMIARLFFQFKSFTMSSHTKTLVTNLQQKDMAVVQGAILSLALGALSYYIHGTIAGGKIEADMRKAGPGKWMDEAMNRSGLMGVFGEFQRVTTRIPWLKDYTSFGREEVNNRGAGDLTATVLGPTFATLEIADRLARGLEEPTKGTVKSARQLMLPYQNVFWLRRIFDEAEKGLAADLPEKRNN